MNGTVRSAPRPRLWIVAGPNGSGKSSAYDRSDVDEFGGSVWIINPDLLTAKIMAVEGATSQAANLAAVTRIEQWLDASIDAYQTIGVETVLSTPKYRRLVEKAKARGFEVRLIYVFVATAEIQLERIALRVAKGGHDVPPPKVYARRARSFDQLGWFLEAADAAWLFDNSGAAPRLVGRKQDDLLQLSEGIPAEIVDRLTSQA
ncbi:AAA family ATPase [Sphingomonas sp. RIT328]|uniref:AAA family ATPase n=1 Tax=Sphingomonas sp. RIT328 TaxID=1470591 RepID=UPI0004508F55|nr:zeta toxin family protein [Sphingomonas sp. RIT328]EZP56738.1 Zeta toxin [Sphingomonas sp. RIT328]